MGQGEVGAVCRRHGRAGAPSDAELRGYIEERLETWIGLEINREKTRVVDLKEEEASLDFLGYTFRYDRDLGARAGYLNMVPSKKSPAAGAGRTAGHDRLFAES